MGGSSIPPTIHMLLGVYGEISLGVFPPCSEREGGRLTHFPQVCTGPWGRRGFWGSPLLAGTWSRAKAEAPALALVSAQALPLGEAAACTTGADIEKSVVGQRNSMVCTIGADVGGSFLPYNPHAAWGLGGLQRASLGLPPPPLTVMRNALFNPLPQVYTDPWGGGGFWGVSEVLGVW